MAVSFAVPIFKLISVGFIALFAFFVVSEPIPTFASASTINFQGKITNSDGTNLLNGAPGCVVAGADTCDLRFAIYSDSGATTPLWIEDHDNVELGANDGIFSLRLNEICAGWTSTVSSDCSISNGGVTFSGSLYYVLFFDTDGNGDFSGAERFPTSNTTEMSSVSQALGMVGANGEYITNSSNGTVKVGDSGGTNSLNINTNGSATVAEWFEFVDGTNTVSILTGTQNPSSVATNADIGSLFLNSSSGNIYVKTDDGSSTNWSRLATMTSIDLDTAYDNDSDKTLTVDNASGLTFSSTVSGDIDIDLTSTGDFTISDAGTPFATFADNGNVGIGDTTPTEGKLVLNSSYSTADANTVGFSNTMTDSGSVTTLILTKKGISSTSNYTGSLSASGFAQIFGADITTTSNTVIPADASGQTLYLYGIRSNVTFSGSVSEPGDVIDMRTIEANGTTNLGTAGTTRKYGLYSIVQGTADTNYSVWAFASGASTNYAVYSAGGTNYFGDNVGIGDDTPSAALTVGSGDLFQVNSSGAIAAATGITSSGTITFSGLNTAGAVVYTNGSGTLGVTAAGTSGQCLISGGTGAPTWTACETAVNNWTMASGALYPNNPTVDLLIGGTATTSAKFAFINVNSGTPTASVSAGATGATYLTAAGTLTTTAGQNLTLGGSTAGSIYLLPANSLGRVGINTTSPLGNLHVKGTDVSSVDNYRLYVEGTDSTNLTTGSRPVTGINSTLSFSGQMSGGSTSDLTGAYSSVSSSSIMAVNGNTEFLNLYGNRTVTSFSGTVGESSDSLELFGTYSIVSGNLGTTGSTNKYGLRAQVSGSADDNYGVYSSVTGGNRNYGGYFVAATGATVNYGLYVSASGGTTNYGVYSVSSGAYNFFAGNVGIGDTDPVAALTVGSGDLFQVNSSGAIAAATGITSSGTITFSGLNTAGAVVYTNGSGTLGVSAAGTSGQCLLSGGTGSPTWGSCAAAAAQWTTANGTIYPSNATMDLLVGGTATSSAKFALMNVNSGTPTASVSAGATGATYLTAAGTLTTTAGQNLTLGGSTAGSIYLLPANSLGRVGVNTTSPSGNFSVSGGDGVAGNNYRVYVSGTDTANISDGSTRWFEGTHNAISYTGDVSAESIYHLYGTNNTVSTTTDMAANALEEQFYMYGNYNDVTFSGTNSEDISRAYGNYTLVSGDMGTSGDAEKYGNFTVVTGTALANYGYYASVGGATNANYGIFTGASGGVNNFAIYSSIGTNYFAGDTSIGTDTSPDGLLDLTKGYSNSNTSLAAFDQQITDSGTVTTGTVNKKGYYNSFSASGNMSGTSTLNIYGNDIATSYSGTLNSDATAQALHNYGMQIASSFAGTVSNAADTVDITGLNVTSSGTIGTTGANTHTGINITVSGTSDTNYGLFVTSSGATSNYGIYSNSGTNYFSDRVGIGDSSPQAALTVGSGDLFQVNSSGAIAAATGITNTGAVTTSGGIFSLNASSNFATNINTGTSNGAVSIGGGSGTVAIDSTSWDISTGGAATGFTGITSSGTITFSGLNTAGAVVYTNGSGTLGVSAAGTSGQCLISGGTGSPTWSACANGTSAWTQANGTIYPNNPTLDLLVGGTATSSAKFALMNVNSGTPTASISAGTNGAAYLTAAGVLQTTKGQKLTLGGSTTGTVVLAPANSTGRVGINTAFPGATLHINGDLDPGFSTFNAAQYSFAYMSTNVTGLDITEVGIYNNTYYEDGSTIGTVGTLHQYGTQNEVYNGATLADDGFNDTLEMIGTRNNVDYQGSFVGFDSESITLYATYNTISSSIINNTNANVSKYGTYNSISGTGDTHYGTYNAVSGGETNYGMYSIANGTTALNFGVAAVASGGGSSTNYGLHVSSSGGTTNYGVYSTSSGAYNYFAGDTSIGTDTTPDALLDLTKAFSTSNFATIGMEQTITDSGAVSSGTSKRGTDLNFTVSSALSGTSTNLDTYGLDISSIYSGTIESVTAAQTARNYAINAAATFSGSAASSSDTVESFGAYLSASGNMGTTANTKHYGAYLDVSGTADTNYGLYIVTAQGTNNYNIYSTGSSYNYFGGNTSIGGADPPTAAKLDVGVTTSTSNNSNITFNNVTSDSGTVTSGTVNKKGIYNSYTSSGALSTAAVTSNIYGLDLSSSYTGTVTNDAFAQVLNNYGAQIAASFGGTSASASDTVKITGLELTSSGNIGTTAVTSHYGANITVSGTAVNNYGLRVSATGATNNYAATFLVNSSTSEAVTIENDGGYARLVLDGSSTSNGSDLIFKQNGTAAWGLINSTTTVGFYEDDTLGSTTDALILEEGGQIGFGTQSPGSVIDIAPNSTSLSFGAAGVSNLTSRSHTVTLTGANPTTYATFAPVQIDAMTLTGTNAGQTVTNAASLIISQAPIKSTNVAITNTHGLLISSAGVSTATNSYGLTVNAMTGATNNYAAQFMGGNVGIGIAAPAAPLDIDTGSNTTGLRLRGTAETVEIADMFMDTVGNLVISTVNGSDTDNFIELRPEDDNYGLVLRESDGTGTATFANMYVTDAATDYVNILMNAGTSTTTGLFVLDGGKVGIGNSTPFEKFGNYSSNIADAAGTGTTGGYSFNWYVNGALGSPVINGYTAAFYNDGANINDQGLLVKITGTSTSNRAFTANVNGVDKFYVEGDGDVVYVDNLNDISDARLKENFVSLDGSLNKILALKSYQFNMIGQDPSKVELGYKAQEVQTIVPQLVSVIDTENGYLGMNYIGMIPVITDAIKEQNDQIQPLLANAQIDRQGGLSIQVDSSTNTATLIDSSGTVIDKVGAFSKAIIASIQAGTIDTQKLNADEITTNKLRANAIDIQNMSLEDYIKQIIAANPATSSAQAASVVAPAEPTRTVVSKDQASTGSANLGPSASASATMVSGQVEPSVTPSPVASSSTVVTQIASDFNSTSSTQVASGAATVRKSLEDLNTTETDIVLNASALYLTKYTEVDGNAFVSGDLGVNNAAVFGQGLTIKDSGIDYLSFVADQDRNFSILESGKGKVTFLAGVMSIDDKGQVLVNGDIKVSGNAEFAGDVNVGKSFGVNGSLKLSQQNAGEVKIPAGQTELRYTFATPFENTIFIQMVAVDGEKNEFRLKNVDKTGFTVVLEEPYAMERTFNWLAIEKLEQRVQSTQ